MQCSQVWKWPEYCEGQQRETCFHEQCMYLNRALDHTELSISCLPLLNVFETCDGLYAKQGPCPWLTNHRPPYCHCCSGRGGGLQGGYGWLSWRRGPLEKSDAIIEPGWRPTTDQEKNKKTVNAVTANGQPFRQAAFGAPSRPSAGSLDLKR